MDSVRKIAVDDYFNAVEITHIRDKETRKQVKKILDTSNMTVAFGAQPMQLASGLNINDTNEDERVKAVNLLNEALDEAYEMGASGFAFLSGNLILLY
jgi:hypothetical protein